LVGKNLYRLLNFKENSKDKKWHSQLRETERDVVRSVAEMNTEKGKRVLNITLKPIYNKDKKIIAYLGAAMDITEKEQDRASIAKHNKQLEEKIKELERFEELTINREIKMIELKEKIKSLEKKFKK
jgi:hypothetical protein